MYLHLPLELIAQLQNLPIDIFLEIVPEDPEHYKITERVYKITKKWLD